MLDSHSTELSLLSVVIPARDEEACLSATLKHLSVELRLKNVPHEFVVVDDGSTDRTWEVLQSLREELPELKAVQNKDLNGFGRAITYGIEQSRGDAVVIVMADASDDPRDVVTYWEKLNEGWDCVFGSRFIAGGGVIDYPKLKLLANRITNNFIRMLFRHGYNDTTNAFKAYRCAALDGCLPFLAPHFNLTVELPLKCIIRGFTWTIVPITWRNRVEGEAKLKLKEMGSRYLFIILYCWLEKYFSRGDYEKIDS